MFQGRQQHRHEHGPKKYKHYSHSPFSLDHGGVNVKVDETGKIVLSQEHGDGTFDEITTSASLINRILRMLQATRNVTLKDEPFKGEEPDDVERG